MKNLGCYFELSLFLKCSVWIFYCAAFCISLVRFCRVDCLILQEVFLGVTMFLNSRYLPRCNIMPHTQK